MKDLSSELYSLSRTLGKAGSIANDTKNIVNGHPEKVVKKAVKREAYKGLTKVLKNL